MASGKMTMMERFSRDQARLANATVHNRRERRKVAHLKRGLRSTVLARLRRKGIILSTGTPFETRNMAEGIVAEATDPKEAGGV